MALTAMIIIIQGQANNESETIWFSPPFSKNVTTKIGDIFLT